MKLWVVQRIEQADLFQVEAAVVRAIDEVQARDLVAKKEIALQPGRCDEKLAKKIRDFWASVAECFELTPAGDAEIIAVDWNQP